MVDISKNNQPIGVKIVLQRDKILFLKQQKFGEDRLSISGDITNFHSTRNLKIVLSDCLQITSVMKNCNISGNTQSIFTKFLLDLEQYLVSMQKKFHEVSLIIFGDIANFLQFSVLHIVSIVTFSGSVCQTFYNSVFSY